MRICFLSPTLGEAFGQEQVLHDSIRLLESVGHTTFVIAEKKLGTIPSYVRAEFCPELSQIHSLSRPSFVREKQAEVLRLLESFQPDLVHFVDTFDYRLMDAIANRYPCVLTSHSVSTTCPASHRMTQNKEVCVKESGWDCLTQDLFQKCLSHFKSPLHKAHAVQNFLLKKEVVQRRFRKVIAISESMKKILLRDGFEPDKVSVIYNPVHATKFVPSEIKFPPKLILSASRLIPLKGVDHLIQAASKISQADFKLWIYGEGVDADKLKALVKSSNLSDKIEFKGKVTKSELAEAMNHATMLVQPNLGPEGFGMSVAEAMMNGCPVIAYDVPALNELVQPGQTGYLCPMGDINMLAKQIGDLLRNETERKSFSIQAKNYAFSHFSKETFLEKTESVYREILGTASKRLGFDVLRESGHKN